MLGEPPPRVVFTPEARVHPSWEGRIFDAGPEFAYEASPELPDDLAALSALATLVPIPPGQLERAVARALEGPGHPATLLRSELDPRVLRPLARQAFAKGLARSADVGPDRVQRLREVPEGLTIGALQVLSESAVALLLIDGERRARRLEVVVDGAVRASLRLHPRGLEVSLPRVLGAAGDPPRVAVSLYSHKSGRVAVWVADAQLKPVTQGVGVLPLARRAPPRLVSVAGGRVHTLSGPALCELRVVEPALEPRLGPRRAAVAVHGRVDWPLLVEGCPMRIGEYLVTVAAPDRLASWDEWEELLWLDLEAGEVHRTSTPRFSAAAVGGDALWLASREGLFSALPGFSPERMANGRYFTIDANGSHVYAAGDPNEEVPVPHVAVLSCSAATAVFASPVEGRLVRALHTCALLGHWDEPLTRIDRSGRLHRETAEGELSAASAGPLRGVCRGEQVFIEAGGGEARRLRFPFPGALRGGSAGHLVFAAQPGGWDEEGRALFAIDAEAQRERLPLGKPPDYRLPEADAFERCVGAQGRIAEDAVYLVDHDGRRLSRWVPDASGEDAPAVLVPPARVHLRGEHRPTYHAKNPRDDFPMAGLTVSDLEGVYEDAHYGGTTGVCSAPGVRVQRGAVALLVRCTITDGVEVRSCSTLFLVECELRGGWQVDEGAHLVMVGCRDASGPLPDTHPLAEPVAQA